MSGTQPSYDDAVRAREREVEGHIDHGHSVAGWTASGLGLLGSAVASVGMVLALVWLFWVGMAVMLLGLPMGYLLSRAGRGRKTAGHGSGHADKGPR